MSKALEHARAEHLYNDQRTLWATIACAEALTRQAEAQERIADLLERIVAPTINAFGAEKRAVRVVHVE